MKKLTPEEISKHRQRISQLLEELKKLCFKPCHSDLLFCGTPAEVYRKCGKETCRCSKGGEYRHGPYKVIQTWKDGKQRQISIKKTEEDYFKMAEHYQYQQENRKKIIETQEALLAQIDSIIKRRCIWEKE